MLYDGVVFLRGRFKRAPKKKFKRRNSNTMSWEEKGEEHE
jgi:hypothetical protein